MKGNDGLVYNQGRFNSLHSYTHGIGLKRRNFHCFRWTFARKCTMVLSACAGIRAQAKTKNSALDNCSVTISQHTKVNDNLLPA
jgi:hypothetical protein